MPNALSCLPDNTINEADEEDYDERSQDDDSGRNNSQKNGESPKSVIVDIDNVDDGKSSGDDDEENDDMFENPVSMTVKQLAPLSSISEVTLDNMDLGPMSQVTDEIHV